ncbi:fluoride efflux transporter CrcB [Uniformispora flossi]|uniref:fluoride efflux transporter CrcB n=1 Tax=Uniformispora flossi TaxID=3390723 RepID=UPI003C2FC3D3
MSAADWLLVALGAAVAAPLRYWVGVFLKPTWERPFPWGTFTVNAAAALLFGIAAEMRVPQEWIQSLVAVGFCGALSTLSTFAFEAAGLLMRHRATVAVVYVLATVAAGLALSWIGWRVGTAVW